jgi:hypothetical protein
MACACRQSSPCSARRCSTSTGWPRSYPHFDPNAAIRRHAAQIMRQRVQKGISPGNLFGSLIELKDFVQTMPRRINRILDRIADNEVSIRVDAFDEQRLLEGFQKIANRITMGLVLAALIVGAAMLMSVDTPFRLWGYPGLAMILFLAAATGGLILVVNILVTDVKARRKR